MVKVDKDKENGRGGEANEVEDDHLKKTNSSMNSNSSMNRNKNKNVGFQEVLSVAAGS